MNQNVTRSARARFLPRSLKKMTYQSSPDTPTVTYSAAVADSVTMSPVRQITPETPCTSRRLRFASLRALIRLRMTTMLCSDREKTHHALCSVLLVSTLQLTHLTTLTRASILYRDRMRDETRPVSFSGALLLDYMPPPSQTDSLRVVISEE